MHVPGLVPLLVILLVFGAVALRGGPRTKLGLGVVGLILGWYYRPPNGPYDAMAMMGQGREVFLKEPIFIGVIIVSALLVVFGVVDIVRENKPPSARE